MSSSRTPKALVLRRLRHGVARIDRRGRSAWHHEAVVRAAKIKVNQLRKRSAVEKAKKFSDHQRGRRRPDKRCANGFARKQRNTALVKVAFFEQLLISRPGGEGLVLRLGRAPDLSCRSVAGQGVQADGLEVAVIAAEPGLDDEGKAGTIERQPTHGIIETAESNGRIGLGAFEIRVKEPFHDRGRKAAALRPRGHGARVFLVPIIDESDSTEVLSVDAVIVSMS